METFRDRLRMAIEQRGITASELARLSGVGKSDICYYLKGSYLPKQDKVYALSKALGVDPGWMITGVEPKETHEEQMILTAYRLADEGTKSAVKKLLDVPEPKKANLKIG